MFRPDGDHTALIDRIRRRVSDKKVLGLVKAFLKAGVLGEDGVERGHLGGNPSRRDTLTALANIALSVLDDHFIKAWAGFGKNAQARSYRRSKGFATYRLVRYADDFVVLVLGTRQDADERRAEVAAVLSEIGLRLNDDKTRVVHIDDGFDFLGFRIKRDRKRGSGKAYIYTYPSTESVTSIKRKTKAITRQSLEHLLRQLNPVLRGWTSYFRHGVSAATLRIPPSLHMAESHHLATAQTPPWQLEATETPIPRYRMVAIRRERGAVQPGRGQGHPIPLPGNTNPHPLDPPTVNTSRPAESRMR